jgi:signal transduction histidine kinase
VLNKIEPATERRSVQVTVASEVPSVWVDGELIELALRQLLDNALKYSPPDSPISIAIASASGRVQISVADKGHGIPESEQTRIFEKFYRAESSRQQIPGAGLGLAVAREIIHAHAGEIWVESEPGQGSVFHISLPVVTRQAA